VRKALWNLKGKNIAVLGLAFKGGTDDVRESPAIAIVQALLRDGCHVTAYDPAATERAKEVLTSPHIDFAQDPYEATHGADALLILTDWHEFAKLDLARLRKQLHCPLVIDGRNLYAPEQVAKAGLIYCSIGRADALPAKASTSAHRVA
jgi:UDPglucose 6-dehydrogenase